MKISSSAPQVVASQASQKVLARLTRGGGRGTITAMFGRSLHVVVEDRFLVHIGRDDLALTPRSVLLRQSDFERIHHAGCCVGDRVETGLGTLALGPLRIRVCPPLTRLFDPKFELDETVQPLDAISERLAATMLAIDEVLGERLSPFRNYAVVRFCSDGGRRSEMDAAGDVSAQSGVAFRAALWEGADRFLDALQRKTMPAARGAARTIIGLGPGLTPSGDDFLAGFISAAVILKRSAVCAEPWGQSTARMVREAAEGQTTAVSLAMLDDAGEGEVGEAVAAFLRATLQTGDPDEMRSLALDICRIGASSGEDFLNGLATGFLRA